MIASSAAAAIVIGVDLYDQINQAYTASEKLKNSLSKTLSVDPNLESVHELQRDVNDFEKQAQAYASRGMIEKILFGGSEDAIFKQASALNDVKKGLIDIEEAQQGVLKNQARILEASSDPENRKRGAAMMKDIGLQQEGRDLQGKLDDQIKAKDDLKKSLTDFDKEIAEKRANFEASGQEYDAVWTKQEDDERTSRLKAINNANEAIAARRKEIATQARAAEAENSKEGRDLSLKLMAEQEDASRTFLKKVAEERKRRKQLDIDAQLESGTPGQKVSILKSVVADDQAEIESAQKKLAEDQARRVSGAAAAEGQIKQVLQDQLDLEDLITQKKVDQLRLGKQISDNAKDSQKGRRRPLSLEEIHHQMAEQAAQQKRALEVQNRANVERANALSFHGQVSSLRKLGFGKTPGGGASDHEHKMQELGKQQLTKLADLAKIFRSFDDKIGGAA